MALTQISTQGIKDGTITGTDLATNVDLVDNQKLRLGTSNDLQIYHDGSNSYLYQDGTGELRANAATFRVMDRNGGQTQLLASQNGAVELYHGNSKKLQTESWGVDITGTLRADTLKLTDDHKLQFGIGNDLEIYHDGSNSYIEDAGTGALLIKSNTLYLTGTNAANDLASFVEGGAVSLFHNDSKKFETTSSGATVTGSLGIGTTSPQSALHIGASGGDDNNSIRLDGTNNTAGGQVHRFVIENRGESALVNFKTSAANATETTKVSIQSITGNVTMSGSLLINNSNGVNVFSSISMTETSSYGFITSFSGKGIFLRPTSNGVYLDAGDTSFSSGSDERSKTDLTPISDALSKINNCRSVIGRYKTDDISVKRSFLIAQDFQSNFPEAVSVDKNTTEEGNLGLRYQDVIPLLLAGIKELSTKIDVLETEVATLKAS
jgi:hypothetical protein